MSANPPRIIPDMPREAYDLAEGANWSRIKYLAKSPAHYRAEMDRTEDADTTARRLGRVRHIATLEPQRYGDSVAVWRGGDRRAKGYKEFAADNASREVVTLEEHEECMALATSVREHPIASKYLGGRSEVSLFWSYSVPGFETVAGYTVQCKARLDLESDVRALVDLKTTRDASPIGFGRECHNYGAIGQAAMYVDGYEAVTGKRLPYVVIAAENVAPYVVQVYRVPEVLLEQGRQEYRRYLATLALCRREERWPGYSESELELELPRWVQATEVEF